MTSDARTPLRSACIAHLIESDGPGGAERMLAQLVTELQAMGCRNLVILPAKGEGWLAREIDSRDVAIEYFRLERPVSWACARWIRDALRRHDVVLAHSHEFTMSVYGAWASWRNGIPHVATMHGGRYYAQALRRRLALRLAFGLSGQVVAVSDALARHLRRDLWLRSSRIATIPNGVRCEPAATSSLRAELGLTPADRLVLAVGNLYPVKGHRHLLDALALLRQRHPTLHVAIAGRGDTGDMLRARAQELGLAQRLHLLGLRGDIPNLLAAADIFVLPSLSEGLPLALLEAMFASRPIIASEVGEVGTALAGGDAGILVPPGRAEALAAALDKLLAAPADARALGARAARRAAAEYGISRMAARYVAVYEDLLARQDRE
jgi:glycosyltransferase involved in cell wall biosynthesis